MAFEKLLGNWKSIDQIKIKHLGEWKEISQGYEKVAGVWKKIYQAPLFLYGWAVETSKYNTGTSKSPNYVYYITLGVNTYGYGEGVNVGEDKEDHTATLFPDQGTLFSKALSFSTSIRHTLLVTEDGDLYSWGCNGWGQLGTGYRDWTESTYIPRQVGTEKWKMVSAGDGLATISGSHSLAIQENGDLYAWGAANYGQLGDGTTTDKTIPTKIGTAKWKYISAGASSSLGIQENGDLYAWGANLSGQLGDGTTDNKHEPTKIGSDKWVAVAAKSGFSQGINEDGDLYCWGTSGAGQLGDGTTTDKTIPTKIGTAKWKKIKHHGSLGAGIQENGGLYVWGPTSSGQLGDGTTNSPTLTPTRVGTEKWKDYCTPTASIVAVQENGEMYAWGSNTYGQYGDGTTTVSLVPKNILSGVESVYGNGIGDYQRVYALCYKEDL